MNHWRNFKKDRNYLIWYLAAYMAIILTVLSFQIASDNFTTDYTLTPEWIHLALFPLGLIVGVQVPVLIHNCVHRNFKIRILNTIAGELAGFYVLLSMASFELNHIMHHSHADTDLDPHNPYNRGFFMFFLANNFGGAHVVLHRYLQFHGNTTANKLRFQLIMFLHFFNVPLRLLFWFFLLGPSMFVFVFVPSYLFHMFVFSHINYITHETKNDGSVELYNLDSNLYYYFVNFFGSGVYYHKSHHQNPNVYNPKLGKSSSLLFR